MARVFISHSSKDAATARRFAEELRRAGHTPWLAEDEIGVGESIPGAVARGLEAADFVLLLLSMAALESGWVESEVHASVMRQFSSRTERVLPVRLEPVDPPAILAHILYVDAFPDAGSWQRAIGKLVRSIEALEVRDAPGAPHAELLRYWKDEPAGTKSGFYFALRNTGPRSLRDIRFRVELHDRTMPFRPAKPVPGTGAFGNDAQYVVEASAQKPVLHPGEDQVLFRVVCLSAHPPRLARPRVMPVSVRVFMEHVPRLTVAEHALPFWEYGARPENADALRSEKVIAALGEAAAVEATARPMRPLGAAGRASSAPLTWLHVSDLHFRESTKWDADDLLRNLVDDVRGRLENDGLRPDLVFVTGDVAFSGKQEQYEQQARPFLEHLAQAADVPPERIFVVPGNHDVDRTRFSTAAKSTIAKLRGADDRIPPEERQKQIAAIFEDAADDVTRSALFAPLEAYARFAPEACKVTPERPFWFKRLNLGEFPREVVLIGLNSAWTCTGDEDDRNGNLLLGRWQVEKAFELARPATADVVIALVHHPLGWLTEWDAREVKSKLHYRTTALLRGHLHEQEESIVPDGAATLSAGSAYDGRRYPNSYYFGRIELGSGLLTVYVRRWFQDRGGKWVCDPTIGDESSPGRKSIPLPPSLLQAGPR